MLDMTPAQLIDTLQIAVIATLVLQMVRQQLTIARLEADVFLLKYRMGDRDHD